MSDDYGNQDTYDSTSYSYDTSDQNTTSCYDTTTTTAHDYSSATTTAHDYSSSKNNDNNDNSGRHTTSEATERTYRFTSTNDNDNDTSGRHHTTHETAETAHGSTSSHQKNHTPILERTYRTICPSSSNEAVDSDDVTRECIDSESQDVYDTQDAYFTSVAFDDFDSESVDLRTDGSSRKKRNNLIKKTDIENKEQSQGEDEGCCKCWSKSWTCLATFCDCFGL